MGQNSGWFNGFIIDLYLLEHNVEKTLISFNFYSVMHYGLWQFDSARVNMDMLIIEMAWKVFRTFK